MLSRSRWAVRPQLTCSILSHQNALAIEESREAHSVNYMAGVTSMHLDHRVSSAKYIPRWSTKYIDMHKIIIHYYRYIGTQIEHTVGDLALIWLKLH